jgi:hypothetical protein
MQVHKSQLYQHSMVTMKNVALLSFLAEISDKFNELHISLNGPNKTILFQTWKNFGIYKECEVSQKKKILYKSDTLKCLLS